MAKNNGSSASRSAQRSSSAGEQQRSQPNGRGRSSGSSRNASPGSSTGRRRAKSKSDTVTSLASGYRRGRKSGMTAAQSIKNAGSRAAETVGAHPLPAVLIGAGLAWLLIESNSARLRQVGIVERGSEAIGEVGHTLVDAAGASGRVIREAVGTAAEAIAQGASSLSDYVSDATSSLGEVTASGYETMGGIWQRHPLAMAATLLSAGVAAGLLLPGTVRESSLMGEAASNVVSKVRRKSSQLVQEGRRIASTGVKAAAREGRRQGITGEEIVQKAKRIARSVREAATE